MECPNCAADGVTSDMIRYPGETYWFQGSEYAEPTLYSCPDCGHDVIRREQA